MTNENLQIWLEQDNRELINVIKSDIRQHLSKLRDNNVKFYGYAILPGTSYSVDNLVAAFNCETDISPENIADLYYRYSVDEWQNYEHDELSNASKLIKSLNSQFKDLHFKEDSNNFLMDEFEIAYITKLHKAILTALIELRHDGLFGSNDNFVLIWLPDSDDKIIFQSAKALNSALVSHQFISELGE